LNKKQTPKNNTTCAYHTL